MPRPSDSPGAVMHEIPTFPDFRPIELRDREIVFELVGETPIRSSDFAFTNLYAWRKGFPVQISRLGSHLLLMEHPAHSTPHFLPILGPGSIDETAETIAEFLPKIANIPEELIAGYEIFQRKGFQLREDRVNSDYVFLRENLAELKGDEYAEKRQRVRQFEEVASGYQFIPLGPEAFDACIAIHRDWTSINVEAMEPRMVEYEHDAIENAFAHFSELKLMGGVLEVHGRVEGFAMGEPLDSETVVLLFEKANPKLQGIFPSLNRECARKVFKPFRYINDEPDLGNLELRRIKESYHPAHMIPKYILERP